MTPVQISNLLKERYGLVAERVEQLPIGQGTVNYRARCVSADVFVKCYPAGTDLGAETAAMDASRTAGEQGIPVSAVLRSSSDAVIEDGVSVWEWMPGAVVFDRLSPGQYESLGAVLGRIHAAFADLPASAGPAPRLGHWQDTGGLADRVTRLRELVAAQIEAGEGDAFDERAAQTLAERAAMLGSLPSLLNGLFPLGTQLLHGDFALPNVLFDGDRLTAVLDFQPPEPFLVAYELGRAAFGPDQIATDPDWPAGTRTMIAGYLRAHPRARPADVRACGRVALFQLIRSVYGVKEHYLKPGLFQDQLDRFWLRRHHSAAVMLENLSDIDAMLAELAGMAGRD